MGMAEADFVVGFLIVMMPFIVVALVCVLVLVPGAVALRVVNEMLVDEERQDGCTNHHRRIHSGRLRGGSVGALCRGL